MNQPLVLGLHARVAFAGNLAEAVEVGDLDMPPAIVNEFGLVQRLATSDTLLRRAPIICAIDSWVRTRLLLPDRSRVCSRHRASRDSTVCAALHPAVCWIWAYTASPCRTSVARNVALCSAAVRHDRYRASRRCPAPARRRCSTLSDRPAQRTCRRCCRGRPSRSEPSPFASFTTRESTPLCGRYARLSASSTSTSTVS